MIFGILGSFGIEIGDPIFFVEQFFVEKNPKTFGRNFFGTKFFQFSTDFFSMKKSMKIQNFEISKNFRKNRNFKNFEFSLTFSTIFFSIKNRKKLVPKKFRPKSVRIFFDENVFDKNIFVHLFRSQISPRFQKSRLEKRAGIKKIRKGRPGRPWYKKRFIFPLFAASGTRGSKTFCVSQCLIGGTTRVALLLESGTFN